MFWTGLRIVFKIPLSIPALLKKSFFPTQEVCCHLLKRFQLFTKEKMISTIMINDT